MFFLTCLTHMQEKFSWDKSDFKSFIEDDNDGRWSAGDR